MPRPDATRLDPARYPHRAEIQTRFADLDPQGHINNVAMATLFETARLRFNHAMGFGRRRAGGRWLVARVEINYLAEGHFPADMLVVNGIGRIGTRSWSILSCAFQDDRPIATCETVVVLEASEGTTAIPDDMRAMLEEYRVGA